MGEVVSCLAGVAGNSLFRVAKNEITRTWNCTKNVEKLKNEAENLTRMKGRIQQQIDLAKLEGKVLVKGVKEWVEKASASICDATEFITEEAEANKTYFNSRLCVNLSAIRHYSKRATKKTCALLQHQEDGKNYETCVSVSAPTTGFVQLYQKKNLENIDTQKSTLEKIINAIEDNKTQIVGINGLGGVGKTTLASEVAAKMKNKFVDIVFITISQTVDAKMIEEKVRVAASKIINGEKVLIILDDVWEELKLEKLGIPTGINYMNCKILLTSRSKYVCEAMNTQKNISVNPLKGEEAWTLFERVVGKTEWDDKLKNVALKIVQECCGLPLFVQAVGKALKNKDIKIWKTALRRLQATIDGDATYKREGILQLKLSYDYLEDEVAKACFLLSSMFPEDGTISLKRLTYYGLGLGIFNNLHSIQDAKDRVQLAVESLKSSFLLLPEDRFSFINLPEEEEEYFKMHDLVREMALFTTSTDDNKKFLVLAGKGLTEWPPIDGLEIYKKISFTQNIICKLPDHELDFPHLDTFLIRNNKLSIVPEEFFKGMKGLKVLDMSGNNISSLPQSLEHLTKLRTLDLSSNKSLCDISVLGKLICLQILKLGSTGITQIPKEIGQLTKLRVLDVYGCLHLRYVAPGVISKLFWLEELYVKLLIVEMGSCNFIVELSELKWLKILHLKLPILRSIPENANFETLIEFDIGEPDDGNAIYHCKRRLHISDSRFPFNMPIVKLIQVSEVLELSDIACLDNILPDLYQQGFDELKYIELKSCEDVKTLVKTSDPDAMQRKKEGKFFSKLKSIMLTDLYSLELLWDRPHQYISFSNLAKIKIGNCPALKKLFPSTVAQGLVNLRDLYISNCQCLVVVISNGDEQTSGSKTELVKHDPYIVFSFTDIHLDNLPKLESFCSGHSIIKYPYLMSIKVKDCRSMKRWSYGENHTPKMHFDHQGRPCSNINDYIALQHEMNRSFVYKNFPSTNKWSTAPAPSTRQTNLNKNYAPFLPRIK